MFSRKRWKEAGTAYTLLSPTLFVLLLFVIGPILFAIYLSFHKVQLLGTASFQFVGFDNFTRILDDTRAKIALWNTVKYVVIVVPTQTMLALVLAATLNAGLKGGEVFPHRLLFADINVIGCIDAYFYVDVQPKRACQPRARVSRLADVQLAWRSVCCVKRHYDHEHLVNGTVFYGHLFSGTARHSGFVIRSGRARRGERLA